MDKKMGLYKYTYSFFQDKNAFPNYYEVAFCLYFSEKNFPVQNNISFLHEKELEYFSSLKYDKRKIDYLIGRYAAKQAVNMFLSEKNLNKIFIEKGILNQPIVKYPDNKNLQVSLSHCNGISVALAFQEEIPIGIDIEKIDKNRNLALKKLIICNENEITISQPYPIEITLTLFWSAKEALSKVLKTGLLTSFSIFEINQIEKKNSCYIINFKNFPFKAASFVFNDYICSIVYPFGVSFNLNHIERISEDLEKMTKTNSSNDTLKPSLLDN